MKATIESLSTRPILSATTITSNLSSMAIVREREIGTLEQLNVTPLGRLELITVFVLFTPAFWRK